MPASDDTDATDDAVGRRTLLRAKELLQSSPLGAERAVRSGDESGVSEPGSAAGAFLGSDHDGRSYRLYVPPGYDADEPVPLLVFLHGCRQTPAAFAAETGMNEVAADETFLVAYPKQSRFGNPLRCWNWYDDTDATRGNGELAWLADLTHSVIDEFAVDEDRVYVAGLSAGGSMAARAIVEYTDLFAAAGVHSGPAYDAVGSALSALSQMYRGDRQDGREAGIEAYEAMADRARAIPTIVFHGTDDDVVDVANARQLTAGTLRASHLGVDGDEETLEVEPDRVETGTSGPYEYARRQYRDGSGTLVVEEWLVDGMGHAWSGGSSDGRFTAPNGPDASRLLWQFVSEYERSTLEAVADARWTLPIVGPVSRSRLSRVQTQVRAAVSRLIER
ncbi:PHB depolymerase family esterase [Haloterrigena sp. H1]|uniref:extracellular catalytic domain type 1 short-chain-length polyhydroxyalkanoate depolymerase n=1 Tax=Haloterrigena sp. H1 TaxID=2552943 RepID=UPI00110DEF3B|nr:PHB depolymerase family esterase [Haloterrigena sp. H1]TMT77633.1 PHB depolymerase family esterase [Haloterrigena sp. H1]TMT87803.1 PHB depolymerase family esterase [Haloterrigena sp. H1]